MSEPQFAVGDRVRHRASGELGVVLFGDDGAGITVSCGFGKVRQVQCCAIELEPTKPAPTRPLRVGDRVAVEGVVVRTWDDGSATVKGAVSGEEYPAARADLRLVEPAPEGEEKDSEN